MLPRSLFISRIRRNPLIAPHRNQPHHIALPISNPQFSTTPLKIVKDTATVIDEFNSRVNMTASELEDWLREEASQSSGWSKSDGGDSETVGHESGRKIIEILKKNPKKDPEKYDEDDLAHMRKVTSYLARHLAQEEKAKQNPESKSSKSLRNWGHDPHKG